MMIKGEKSKIPSLQHHLFLPGECHRNENKHLTKIQNRKCLQLFFSIRKYRDTSHIFLRYHPDTFMSLAIQNPHGFFILHCVIQLEAAERAF